MTCGWVPGAKNVGLRFRALLDGSNPELSLDAVWS